MKNLVICFSKRLNPMEYLANIRTCVLALCLSVVSGVSADDTDLFFSGDSIPPNILFVLDTSGSMDTLVDLSEGEVGPERMRITVMVDALVEIIKELEGMNVGLVSYSSNTRFREEVKNVDVAANKAELIRELENLEPVGGTYTVEALFRSHLYFNGRLRKTRRTNYRSPITHECQQNHVVLLTDGVPSPGRRATNIANSVERYMRIPCTGRGGEKCGAQLGKYMFDNDHADGLTGNNIPGTNNIITHTVGFDLPGNWLPSISGNTPKVDQVRVPGDDVIYEGGHGKHFLVKSASELKNAFKSILDGVSTTFATPTVSTNSYNESRHRSELFYAQFQPSESLRWDGNVKKYKIEGGAIVDYNGDAILDDNGVIKESSRSLWADKADGGSVAQGGFAHNLPDHGDRLWYTDYASTDPFRLTPANFDAISIDELNAVDGEERDKLLSWALGSDVDFGTADDTTAVDAVKPNHHYIGDSLHNSPVLLSYWAKTADTEDRHEVLYSGNNLGVLHAIDADTGVELWSYTPEEHLDNIKKYYTDEKDDNHVYGLDGEFTLHTTRTRQAGYEYMVDDAWLFMTERRGGNRVYALDVSATGDVGLPTAGGSDPFSVMWKITGGVNGSDNNNDGAVDFPDLADTWSKPQMITVSQGCPDNCKDRELLMFSGGYNPDIYDIEDLDYDTFSVPTSGHGNAVYFVEPKTGELVWSVGNGVHHDLDLPMEHSVPSTPVPVDTDLDGVVDVMFFVDVSGDIWRVDFDHSRDFHGSGGKIAELSPQGQSLRFFNPVDVVITGTSYSTAQFYLVTGSGMRSSPLYEEPNPNRLYSIVDRWVHEAPYKLDAQDNKVPNYNYVVDASDNRSLITADPDILRNVSDDRSVTSTEYGFFKTFEPGEKILQPTRIHRGRVFTNTYVPAKKDAVTTVCDFDAGTTRLYITSLPSGINALPDTYGGEYLEVGDGLLSGGELVDTGEEGAPYLLIDKTVLSVEDLVAPDNTEVFRRFKRTGWVELDDDHNAN